MNKTSSCVSYLAKRRLFPKVKLLFRRWYSIVGGKMVVDEMKIAMFMRNGECKYFEPIDDDCFFCFFAKQRFDGWCTVKDLTVKNGRVYCKYIERFLEQAEQKTTAILTIDEVKDIVEGYGRRQAGEILKQKGYIHDPELFRELKKSEKYKIIDLNRHTYVIVEDNKVIGFWASYEIVDAVFWHQLVHPTVKSLRR